MLPSPILGLFSIAALTSVGNGPVDPEQTVRIDAERGEIVVTVGPLRIPAATHYHHHHHADEQARFVWPEAGWAQGYRFELVDAHGTVLPREMMHHAGVVDHARRQLASPAPERLFAAGRETADVRLPGWMGLRMDAGTPLVAYFALVNPTEEEIVGASLRISVVWRSAAAGPQAPRHPSSRPYHPSQQFRRPPRTITEIVPLVVGAGPDEGGWGTFDLPPGLSATSSEFTLRTGGRLRALGGHLHDHAVEIRLEDARSGEVLARLGARRDGDGRLLAVEQERFLLKLRGLRVDANRPYRVVAVYDNPTGSVIPEGAMAYLAGPFIPDDPASLAASTSTAHAPTPLPGSHD
jgi:hypothetical protein